MCKGKRIKGRGNEVRREKGAVTGQKGATTPVAKLHSELGKRAITKKE